MKNESGRSMVEMLGVLAIIGVLSVGALAGFNKAMRQHKINQFVVDWEQFLAGLTEYEDYLTQEAKIIGTNAVKLLPYIQNLHILPDGWTVPEDNRYQIFYDNFQNKVIVQMAFQKTINIDYYLTTEGSGFREDLCLEMVSKIIKPNSNVFQYFSVYRGSSLPSTAKIYGNRECTGSHKCIKDMTMSDVLNTCNVCVEDNACTLSIHI